MVTFNYTEEFYRQLKRLAKHYRSLADDLDTLQHDLMKNPEIVVLDVTDTCINLLTIYDKKEIANVSDKYIDELIRSLK